MSQTAYHDELLAMGVAARTAARRLAVLPGDARNRCLEAMAARLVAAADAILAANAADLAAATRQGLSQAMLDRLALTPARVAEMAKGLRTLTGLPDPVGRKDATWLRPNGLRIEKVRVPIGVIAIIYEARPNVTADAAGLCLKAGNVAFLRGGSEAMNSNRAIVEALKAGLRDAAVTDEAVQWVPWTDRAVFDTLLTMDRYIDLVIPRGGEGLIRRVVETSTIPVIKHYKGVCHVYVHAAADPDMALAIIENAKCQRPATCNACEKVLIDAAIAESFAPRLAERLRARGVELRGDEAFRRLVPDARPATEEDWYAEYLDLILAVRIVPGIEAAIEHIAAYGSNHSDAIVTDDREAGQRFVEAVDSAAVYINASTRFTDGAQFGMGAEMGISTDRIHARGPMGIEELTSYKYVVYGSGQVRT